MKQLGGADAAGFGFALGVERLLLSMAEDAVTRMPAPDVFVAPIGDLAESEAIHVAHRWRRDGVRVELGSGGRSLKSQMRVADKSGSAYVLILGEAELAAAAFSVRDMVRKRDFAAAIALGAPAAALREGLARLVNQPEERSA